MKKILKLSVLTLFLHSLIMLLYRNFNCRFDHVPGVAPLSNFQIGISIQTKLRVRFSQFYALRDKSLYFPQIHIIIIYIYNTQNVCV
jgi:hypothetical protein